MPRERDPLSVVYDDFSGRFLALLAGDLYGWHTATVRSPARDPLDERGLSRTERAVQRSLFYVLNSTAAEGPQGGRWVKNPELSLAVSWGAPAYSGGIIRRLFRTGERRRVVAGVLRSGRLVGQHYAAADRASLYTVNADEQSQALQL